MLEESKKIKYNDQSLVQQLVAAKITYKTCTTKTTSQRVKDV